MKGVTEFMSAFHSPLLRFTKHIVYDVKKVISLIGSIAEG